MNSLNRDVSLHTHHEHTYLPISKNMHQLVISKIVPAFHPLQLKQSRPRAERQTRPQDEDTRPGSCCLPHPTVPSRPEHPCLPERFTLPR